MEENSVFDDIIQGLNEVEEYQKGNIQLKSEALSSSKDDISIRYNKLPDDDKRIVSIMIDKLLFSNRKAI